MSSFRSIPPESFQNSIRRLDIVDCESPFEVKKRHAVLRALPRDQYASVLDVGCGFGHLTYQLAHRAKSVVALDFGVETIEECRRRCEPLGNVAFLNGQVPRDLPSLSTQFDLIMVSEIAYYLTRADWCEVIEGLVRRLSPRGHLFLCHWRPRVPGLPLDGDAVHEIAIRLAPIKGLKRILSKCQTHYRFDVFERSSQLTSLSRELAAMKSLPWFLKKR